MGRLLVEFLLEKLVSKFLVVFSSATYKQSLKHFVLQSCESWKSCPSERPIVVMPAWDSGNSIDSIAVQEVSAAREEEHTSTPFLSLGADERHRNFEDLNKPSQFLT